MTGQPYVLRRAAFNALIAGVVVAVIAAAGCSREEKALTIYSGRTENLVGPLLEKFAKDKGVPIDVRYGDSADLALLIAEEGKRSPADVFFSQSPGAVGFLAGKGLLGTMHGDELEKVEPKFRSKSGRWAGVSARQRVLVYNTKMVAEADLPQSVFELTASKYAGKVAVAPQNASFQDFITAMRQIKSPEQTAAWLAGMAANKSPVYPNNNAIVAAVARGEVAMGLANHYYNYRFLQEDPSADSRNHIFAAGDIGSLVLAASVSVLATADKPAEAAQFVDYLLSRQAQQYFADQTFEYPLAGGVRAPRGLPPLDSVKAPSYDLDRLGGGLKETAELIAKSGIQR